MTSRSGAELAGKCYKYATLAQSTDRKAVDQSALFAKETFIKAAVSAGLRQGGALPKASGARWGVRYDIRGAENPTALIRYVGPVHWAFGGTDPHFMAASQYGNFRAGSRNSLQGGKVVKVRARNRKAESLESELGANLAFGGSAKGIFGDSLARTRAADAKRLERGRRVRARKKALKTPQGLRAYAFHPGAKGRNAWPLAKNLVMQRAPLVYAEAHRMALIRSGFGR